MSNKHLTGRLNNIVNGFKNTRDEIQKIHFLIDQGADVSYLNSKFFNNNFCDFLRTIKNNYEKEEIDDLIIRLVANGLSFYTQRDDFIRLLCRLSQLELSKSLKLLLPKIEKDITYKDYVGLMQVAIYNSSREDILDYLSEMQPQYFIKMLETESYNIDGVGIYIYLLDKKLIENKKIAKNLIRIGFYVLPYEALKTLYGIVNEDEPVKVNDEAKEALKEVVKEIEKDDDYEVIEHIKKHGSLPPGVKFVPKEE